MKFLGEKVTTKKKQKNKKTEQIEVKKRTVYLNNAKTAISVEPKIQFVYSI